MIAETAYNVFLALSDTEKERFYQLASVVKKEAPPTKAKSKKTKNNDDEIQQFARKTIRAYATRLQRRNYEKKRAKS